jgi:acyl carrier protein
VYGPTETTIWSTVERVRAGDSITIGRPIANTRVYILDRDGEPAPIGVPGELWIGGDGVARGYHGRPDLTAERFVPDPFLAGGRMYRTGDLARWRADGRLEHLGRLDFQVKVRGFRIELGEVESAVLELESVREAVVVAHGDGAGDARLVAYVVWEGEELTASDARRLLRKRLPEYMVPSLFVGLDGLPLTPNGKIDRKALPNPFAGMEAPRREHVPPATPSEELLASIWREELGVAAIGRNDNFFDLGGHSLLSMRAVYAVEQRTGIRMNPRTMFFQDLQQIAAWLDEQRGAVGTVQAVLPSTLDDVGARETVGS